MEYSVSWGSVGRITILLVASGFCATSFGNPYNSKQQREHRKQVQKERPRKQIKHMTLEEAVAAARYYEEGGDLELLIVTYQHIMAQADNPDTVAEYGIKLADLYLSDGNFAEAKKQYKKVITLYPGYHAIERARFREVMTHFWSTPFASRDQSTTLATITLGKSYLRDYPDERGAQQVKGMVAELYKKLLASEILILRFYLNKYEYTCAESAFIAAEQRLVGIVTDLFYKMVVFVPSIEELQGRIEINEVTTLEAGSEIERAHKAQLISAKADMLEAFLAEEPLLPVARKDMRDRF